MGRRCETALPQFLDHLLGGGRPTTSRRSHCALSVCPLVPYPVVETNPAPARLGRRHHASPRTRARQLAGSAGHMRCREGGDESAEAEGAGCLQARVRRRRPATVQAGCRGMAGDRVVAYRNAGHLAKAGPFDASRNISGERMACVGSTAHTGTCDSVRLVSVTRPIPAPTSSTPTRACLTSPAYRRRTRALSRSACRMS